MQELFFTDILNPWKPVAIFNLSKKGNTMKQHISFREKLVDYMERCGLFLETLVKLVIIAFLGYLLYSCVMM